MTDTLTILIPALAFLASTAGAGYAASHLFDALRQWQPQPTQAQWAKASRPRRWLWAALWSPRGARLTVFGLAAAIAVAASVATALATGREPLPAFDAALAVIVSQMVHGAGLSGRVEAPAAPARPEGA